MGYCACDDSRVQMRWADSILRRYLNVSKSFVRLQILTGPFALETALSRESKGGEFVRSHRMFLAFCYHRCG